MLDARVEALNAVTAVLHGRFRRRRADGTGIETIGATYVVAEGPAGLRISTLILHGA